MRTIHLLRHAKSSWDEPGLDDHERPLAGRGMRATPVVAAHMRRTSVAPQLVLCSSARRTRETLELLGEAVPGDAHVVVEDGLYAAGTDDLLERLRRLPRDVDEVLVIGHNPTMQRTAAALAGSGDDLGRLQHSFPTAALATLVTEVDRWAELVRGGAHLAGYVRPKDLDAPR